MNAVERLLAHGERVLSLFDEMFIDRLGSGRPAELPDVPMGLIHHIGHMVIDAMPTGEYWTSVHWLQAAAEAAWFELKKPTTPEETAERTAILFREYLAQREQLLSDVTWRRLLADVVFESRMWEPFALRVAALAEDVAEQVRQVEQVPNDTEPLLWEREQRVGLRTALDRLHPYAQPPKPASAIPEKPTRSGGRLASGGRPKKYPAELRQAIIADRKREERKKNPLPLKTWVTTWATEHGMKRADAMKMYQAELASIRRAQQARSR